MLYSCFTHALLILKKMTLIQVALTRTQHKKNSSCDVQHMCWRMLTYADVSWQMLTYADVCWRKDPTTGRFEKDTPDLTYADVCWRILTYADVRTLRQVALTRTHRTHLKRNSTWQVWEHIIVYEALNYSCMRPWATCVWGLKHLVYAALRYFCMRPSATRVCRLTLLVYQDFSYSCIRPEATPVFGLQLLLHDSVSRELVSQTTSVWGLKLLVWDLKLLVWQCLTRTRRPNNAAAEMRMTRATTARYIYISTYMYPYI